MISLSLTHLCGQNAPCGCSLRVSVQVALGMRTGLQTEGPKSQFSSWYGFVCRSVQISLSTLTPDPGHSVQWQKGEGRLCPGHICVA